MKFRVAALWAIALFLLPLRLHAHAHLASSKPAKGDTVRVPLTEIHLTFTEAVDERYTVVVLLDATGHDITFGKLYPVGGSPTKEWVLRLEHPLIAGAYSVKWKAAGSDGHANGGMFEFFVDVDEAIKPVGKQSPAPPVTPAPAHTEHEGHNVNPAQQSTEIGPMYRPDTSIVWMLTRWVNFLALMLMVGAVAFRFGVAERANLRDDAFMLVLDDATRRLAVTAGQLALTSSALRLWLQSGSLNGEQAMWSSALLKTMILKTGWGKAWLAQTLASAGFLVSALIKTDDRRESWYPATAFALIAAAAPAFSGHAAAVQQMAIVPVLDDAVHVIAASAWLGTLFYVLAVALPAAVRSGHGAERTVKFVHTFSPLALVMATIALLTGAMNAFVQIKAFSDLWTTSYGKILALKIGLVIITLSMGAYNWRVAKPRLGTNEAAAHIRKSATAEIVVAVVIVAITAILVGTPTE